MLQLASVQGMPCICAAALDANANSLATLDDVLARNARRMKVEPLAF